MDEDNSSLNGFLIALTIAVVMVGLIALITPYPELSALIGEQQQHAAAKNDPIPHMSAMGDLLGFFDSHGEAFTALATIAVAWFTWTLRGSTNKLWSVAKRDADTAEKAVVDLNRAFVHGVPEQGDDIIDEETKSVTMKTGRVRWFNNGNTPTRDMFNHFNFAIAGKEVPPNWDFPDFWPHADRSPTPLGVPARGVALGPTLEVNESDIKDAVAKKKFIYVWGWATYSDVFEGTPRHVTRFAIRVIPKWSKDADTGTEKVTFRTELLNRYNRSDKECERQGFGAEWKPRQLAPGVSDEVLFGEAAKPPTDNAAADPNNKGIAGGA